jgi:hypothetical protein
VRTFDNKRIWSHSPSAVEQNLKLGFDSEGAPRKRIALQLHDLSPKHIHGQLPGPEYWLVALELRWRPLT